MQGRKLYEAMDSLAREASPFTDANEGRRNAGPHLDCCTRRHLVTREQKDNSTHSNCFLKADRR